MPSEIETRDARRRHILGLLRSRRVGSQVELARWLREAGFEATQSSVSRDLRSLGVSKVDGRYELAQRPPAPPEALDEIARYLRGAQPAGPHLMVLRCAEGAAQRVGVALDRVRWPEVVGTVAGDDTVFVALAGAAAQRQVLRRLDELRRRRPQRAGD